MKTHTLKLFTLIWVLSSFISMGALANGIPAEETVLFVQEDPVNDELGPGTYTYPLHKHFEPYNGLFDLTRFAIVETGQTYRLEFTFNRIADPWRAKYGFSHPLLQIYIDNTSGGDGELFKPGANVKLDPDAPWDAMLHITGWWVRLFHPVDREKLSAMEIYWNDAKNPFDLETAKVKLDGSLIRVEVPKEVLGNLTGSRIFVMVGSFYAFGYDHYRDIELKASDWAFGGTKNPKLAPRVLDLLLPEGMEQEEVLRLDADAETFVTIPYIRVGKRAGLGLDERGLIWLLAFIVAILLVVIIVRKSKKNPVIS